ncbi:MAG: putative sulfate exporter family transporter [Synergistaceae bacterium]|nr:putative sulfate exporter family transporter [Synergistaceae bacterium]
MEKQLRNITSNLTAWLAAAALISILTSNPAWGLLLGSIIALFAGNPVAENTGKVSKKLLQISVILLGFGMHFDAVISVGLTSVWVTMISISFTLIIGTILGRMFGVERDLSLLLSTGTAICGGSAIAAMSPSIGASQSDTGVAMAVIFLLNGLGLLIFPAIGHLFELSQQQFGFWAALAIHDTSSVVGAAAIYGAEALAIGTTVKLTRALWILPLAFGGAKLNRSESRPPFQWFLVGFLAAAAARSFFPTLETLWSFGSLAGKHLMTGTLFLIGAGLSRDKLKKIGFKPLLMAVTLWLIISILSLTAVIKGFMPHLNI